MTDEVKIALMIVVLEKVILKNIVTDDRDGDKRVVAEDHYHFHNLQYLSKNHDGQGTYHC